MQMDLQKLQHRITLGQHVQPMEAPLGLELWSPQVRPRKTRDSAFWRTLLLVVEVKQSEALIYMLLNVRQHENLDIHNLSCVFISLVSSSSFSFSFFFSSFSLKLDLFLFHFRLPKYFSCDNTCIKQPYKYKAWQLHILITQTKKMAMTNVQTQLADLLRL